MCESNNTEVKLILPETITKTPRVIAIDYDDTLSLSPNMWRDIIPIFKAFGFNVCIVTYRSDNSAGAWGYGSYSNADMDWAINICDQVVFTAGKSKRDFCAARGIYPHIWIDDSPEAIVFTNCYDDRIQNLVRNTNRYGPFEQ